MRRNLLILFVAFIGLITLPGIYRTANATPGLEPQSSSSPAPGVSHTDYLDAGPNVIHVTRIAAGAAVVIKAVPASSSGHRATASVATLCQRVQAVVCINGDFFVGRGTPLGGELVDGKWLRSPTVIEQPLWLDSSNRFSIGAEPATALQSLGATSYAILTPGQPMSIPEHDKFADGLHARTLVGWNAAGDSFLVTVEQDAHSKGMSLAHAAAVLRQLGSTTAVNEDGGQSSQMVVNGALLGAAGDIGRPVANIWAVVALPPAAIAPAGVVRAGVPPASLAPTGSAPTGAGRGLQGIVVGLNASLKAVLHPATHPRS